MMLYLLRHRLTTNWNLCYLDLFYLLQPSLLSLVQYLNVFDLMGIMKIFLNNNNHFYIFLTLLYLYDLL